MSNNMPLSCKIIEQINNLSISKKIQIIHETIISLMNESDKDLNDEFIKLNREQLLSCKDTLEFLLLNTK